jgi:4-oxalocrotonate tautomerase
MDMPLIQINLASGRSVEEKRALLTAVTEAVHTTLGVSKSSIRVWINEFGPTDYMAAGVFLADREAATG